MDALGFLFCRNFCEQRFLLHALIFPPVNPLRLGRIILKRRSY